MKERTLFSLLIISLFSGLTIPTAKVKESGKSGLDETYVVNDTPPSSFSSVVTESLTSQSATIARCVSVPVTTSVFVTPTTVLLQTERGPTLRLGSVPEGEDALWSFDPRDAPPYTDLSRGDLKGSEDGS